MENSDEPKIKLGKSSLETVVATIATITPSDLDRAYSWGQREKIDAAKKDYYQKVRGLVGYFRGVGVSGRLPGQITTIALYGLSLLTTPASDDDVEKVTLAAAKAVLGNDYDFYHGYYVEQKAEAAKNVAGVAEEVSGKIKLVKGSGAGRHNGND